MPKNANHPKSFDKEEVREMMTYCEGVLRRRFHPNHFLYEEARGRIMVTLSDWLNRLDRNVIERRFLGAIVRTKCIDCIRSYYAREARHVIFEDEGFDETSPTVCDLEDSVEMTDKGLDIERILDHLDPNDADFIRGLFSGMSITEIHRHFLLKEGEVESDVLPVTLRVRLLRLKTRLAKEVLGIKERMVA